jgi:2-oxoglutarate dehydrogenase E2 component (dihydrolipoamide succinyltransferase)
MGESIFEGTITKWLKQPGDQVQRDEPLFEISTDKVDAEIPAPASGVLKEIKAKAGETVQVNTVVATIDAAGSASATPSAKPAAAEPPKSAPQPDGTSSAAPGTSAPAVPAAGPKTDVVMPQMGESIFEGTITKWLKNVGDTVQRDEPLFEISTDKVDAEIPSPTTGVLSDIKVQAGTTVQVNTVVATIGGAAGAAAPAPAPKAAAPAPSAPAPQAAAPQPPAPEPEEEVASESGDRIRTSPLVRKLAKEANVDLGRVHGTGMGGRITKEDIQAFVDKQKTAPSQPAPQPHAAQPAPTPGAPTPAASANKFAGTPGLVEPMSVMRKKIAEHMVMSKRTSAHVHGVFEVDVTRIVKIRERRRHEFEKATGMKLTFTPFFARAAVHGIRKWPIINSSVEGENIRYHASINLGIAVALDWGLIVPVVKNAEERSFVGLQKAISDLGERARTKKLKPEDVQGGTFTITNPGIFGAKFGMPIISQPQLAILGIGAITKVPSVVTDKDGNDSIAIRSRCHISIGYDHRVIDGAVADQFMSVIKSYLENWNEPLL